MFISIEDNKEHNLPYDKERKIKNLSHIFIIIAKMYFFIVFS